MASAEVMRFGGVAAYVSGVVAAVGIVFLIAVQYSLAVPAAVGLHALVRPRHSRLSGLVLLIGIIGMLAVVVLQLLLVFGVLAFERQVLMVVLALVVVGLWLLITGNLARPILPHSQRMSLLAIPYVGYPIWAFWLGTHLLSRSELQPARRS